MSDDILRRHKTIWENKPVLRHLYTEWYREIVSWLCPGRTLELGGGTGNLKEFFPGVVCTDVIRLPWLDLVTDAQYLPFATGSLNNIVLFDTLHHVENVRLFLDEAVRALQSGGRLVVMDPYISWLSWPVYHFFHPEPLDLRADPLQLQSTNRDRRPFDANQAVSTILFDRSYEIFERNFPQFELRLRRRTAFFAYPLSGGFERPSVLPLALVRPLLRIEQMMGFLSRILAFRILVVLEKAS